MSPVKAENRSRGDRKKDVQATIVRLLSHMASNAGDLELYLERFAQMDAARFAVRLRWVNPIARPHPSRFPGASPSDSPALR